MNRVGHIIPMARVTTAIAKALKLMFAINSGQARTAPIGPPPATGVPRKGSVCKRIMIMPMPDMKPDITEYGVKLTKRPILITPRRTWSAPAMMAMRNTSARLSAWVVTMTAMITAIGPVGAET